MICSLSPLLQAGGYQDLIGYEFDSETTAQFSIVRVVREQQPSVGSVGAQRLRVLRI